MQFIAEGAYKTVNSYEMLFLSKVWQVTHLLLVKLPQNYLLFSFLKYYL